MSLDLRLLPIDHLAVTTSGGVPARVVNCRWWGYSHTVLVLPHGAGRPLFDHLSTIAATLPEGHDVSSTVGGRVPDGACKGERCYGVLDRDAYGDLYTWVDAGQLGDVLLRYYPDHPATAYIRALPRDRKVVLDWH